MQTSDIEEMDFAPTMDEILKEVIKRKSSDLHLCVGVPPAFRIDGSLVFSAYNKLKPIDMQRMFMSITTKEQQLIFKEKYEIDFSYTLVGQGRFRINVFMQRGTIAMALRFIPNNIPMLEQIGCPIVLKTLALKSRGLVLVVGSTGSGKSTTLAAMIHLINQTQSSHIITLEDPIEYLHEHNRSIINQREINVDSISFGNALRAALREDPDVILVGEMRDAETVSTAITAAETGHLVFASLHTGDVVQTVDRMIDTFPPHQQQQVRLQLSMTLQGIVAQQLVRRKDNTGRIAALEILVVTPAVRNLIREGKTPQIISNMQTGTKFGMQTMDMALKTLVRQNLISYEEALPYILDINSFTNTNVVR